ncbi:MAG TPA: quinone-dependent dihydroorotate dehydrogenase [Solirubrobacterales bacterium]|nr:quinone-dependent dihydroorotate dehydrogenase [Solirubrobacterales bacterium]
MIYRAFFWLVLQRIDAGKAHDLAIAAMRVVGRIPGLVRMLDRLLRPPRALEVRAFGLEFRSPLGLAAGVDKNAAAFDLIGALGFGAVEVGTATNLPQGPNPGKIVWRLPKQRAILNWMGFPNEGAEAQARRLAGRRLHDYVLGANVGKSRAVELDGDVVGDYRAATRRLAPHAQYLALNVSSPNTPGLRSMQTSEHLRELVAGVRAELSACGQPQLPILIKVAPDLDDEELLAIAETAKEIEAAGIIATNTTTDYDNLPEVRDQVARLGGKGGVSGRPLRRRSLEVLRLLHSRVPDLPVVSVGGIETAEDAWQRILAGATLVQAYTGFVYGGPLWPHRLNRGLARLLAESPWGSLEEARGRSEP